MRTPSHHGDGRPPPSPRLPAASLRRHLLDAAAGLLLAAVAMSFIGIDLTHDYLSHRHESLLDQLLSHWLSLLLAPAAGLGLWIFSRRLILGVIRVGRFYETLLHTSEAVIWEADARDGRFSFVSERVGDLLGYAPAEWRQPGFWLDHLHPDDRQWVSEYCALQNAELAPYRYEARFRARDGHTVWLQNLVTVVARNGVPWRLHGVLIDISERKAAEEHNQRLLAEKDAILNNALVGIAFVRNRHIVACNRRCEELFHYRPGELDSQSTEILYAGHEHYAGIGAQAYSAIARGETYSGEVRFKYRDGTPFWGAMTGRAIDPANPQDASIWILADISHRHNAMEESRRLRRAVEQSPVSIVITDVHGAIEYVNPKFSEVTGYSREDALGQNPRLLRSGLTPDEVYRSLWKTILAGNIWHGELLNRRKNGEQFWEDATIAPVLDENSVITHFIAIKEDITERKRNQDELARHRNDLETLVVERTRALQVALQDAQSADQAKDAFLANVSHEMRTPLNAVIGLSALALANAADPRQRDYLEKISGAGETLLAVIDDLLDLTKIAAGHLHIDAAPFPLRRLLDRLFALLGHRAGEKGLDLRLEVSPNLPDAVVGDALRLNQVLLNLLGNAIKFTPAGHVTLRVGASTTAGVSRLDFAVEDSGIGIAEDALATLFMPFTQADSSITRRFGGTGLGLTICKRLVEMMGGALGVVSRPGHGSTFAFSLTLPLADACAQAATEPESLPPPHFTDTRVLVVEDQALNRQIVAELLTALGITVAQAENGIEALRMLEGAPDGHYSLVLMDLQMPGMDGLTATRRLRAQPRFAALPIVAMTAHTLSHERTEILASGMNEHLGKPFRPATLHALLRRWIPSTQRQNGAAPATPETPATATDIGAESANQPGLDFSGGLHRCGGNPEKYRRWLQTFLDDDVGLDADIERQLAADELEAARQRLHSLKGRSGMLGMTALYAATSALEGEMKRGQAPAALREEFSAAFALARCGVADYLGRAS